MDEHQVWQAVPYAFDMDLMDVVLRVAAIVKWYISDLELVVLNLVHPKQLAFTLAQPLLRDSFPPVAHLCLHLLADLYHTQFRLV